MRLRDWLAGCSGEVRTLVEPLNETLELLLRVVGHSESFIVRRYVRQGDTGVVIVDMFDGVHGGHRSVAGILFLQSR